MMVGWKVHVNYWQFFEKHVQYTSCLEDQKSSIVATLSYREPMDSRIMNLEDGFPTKLIVHHLCVRLLHCNFFVVATTC